MSDFITAAIADHALILHAAVLAAGAFPVLFGTENAFAEQAVLLGAVGAIVDRLRLLDLAEGPRTNIVRARQTDADRAVIVDAIVVGGFRCGGGRSRGAIGAHISRPPISDLQGGIRQLIGPISLM